MIQDKKITTFSKPISALADRPQMTAAELKAWFDSNSTNEIKTAINGIIDELTSANGAKNIGKIGGGTVQDHIDSRNNPNMVTAEQVGAYTKAETDAQINQKVIDIGAGDMRKSIYDTNNSGIVDDSEKLGGKLASEYAPATNSPNYAPINHVGNSSHIIELECSKNGAAFVLNGIVPTENIFSARFSAPADFMANDTIEIPTGRNLIKNQNKSGSFDQNGITYTFTDNGNTVTLNGTATNPSGFNPAGAYLSKVPCLVLEPGTYTFKGLGTPNAKYSLWDTDDVGVAHVFNEDVMITLTKTTGISLIQFNINTVGATFNNVVVRLQMEKGSSLSAFTPYTSDVYTPKLPNNEPLPDGHFKSGAVVTCDFNKTTKICFLRVAVEMR